MRINKLILKNFKAYEDETSFDFNTSKYKNIILIGGKNGAGKSTIFEAIKLCIYGPLAYKYQGFNGQYIHKIKSNINNNALKNEEFTSFVSIDLELTEGTIVNTYTLKREWYFKNQKLNENFSVFKNHSNICLDGDSLNYFDNYLKSIIPPNILDFFFFDGEFLSTFFIGKNSNLNLKQSLLSLCNFDTFNVLKSTILSTMRSDKHSDDETESLKNIYLELEKKLLELNIQKDNIIDEIESISISLDELNNNKSNLESEFRKKGGLLLDERKLLKDECAAIESRRAVINSNIKDFCNDMLPFLIIKNNIINLKTQLDKESDFSVYNSIKEYISFENLSKILSNKIDIDNFNDVVETISTSLTDEIKPHDDNFNSIHNMNKEEYSYVISNIKTILDFDVNTIKNLFDEYNSISEKYLYNKKILNSSVEDSDINEYLSTINTVVAEINSYSEKRASLKEHLVNLDLHIEKIEKDVTLAKDKYYSYLKKNNVHEMSINITKMIDSIISQLIFEKVDSLKSNFMYIFKKIIRKNNFIDFIDIDEKFNISLYINRSYYSSEIFNILNNLGYEEVSKKFGNLFMSDLFEYYKVNKASAILNKLENDNNLEILSLRTKVNIEEFSSGEKQIYILCLYWSLIKTSGIEIPFIIDTPYSRIDETHRNNLTNEYLSTISNQVIILSTNTEIDETLYPQVKPRISNEYLIEYDDKNRKTLQSVGYFFN